MKMKYYETLYLINPNLADEDYEDVVSKFNNVIEKNEGIFIKVDEWGKKTLAYKIKKFDKGYYVLLRYCGNSGITAELKRVLKLDERVLKYQTVKLSDNADPDALKAKIEEGKTKAGEDEEIIEEESTEIDGETEDDQGDENGV
jgi:small subunit ribosomal protein S6